MNGSEEGTKTSKSLCGNAMQLEQKTLSWFFIRELKRILYLILKRKYRSGCALRCSKTRRQRLDKGNYFRFWFLFVAVSTLLNFLYCFGTTIFASYRERTAAILLSTYKLDEESRMDTSIVRRFVHKGLRPGRGSTFLNVHVVLRSASLPACYC